MDISAIEHSLITNDNKADFQTHMDKFESLEAAALDGMGLKKLHGQPFKLPKELDKMEEASRTEFTSGVHKLLNIRKATSIEELKDVNLRDGLAEGSPYDEGFAKAYKEFVVAEKMNYSDMPKNAKFFNTIMAKLKTDNAAKLAADELKAMQDCDAALTADPDFGSKEKVAEQTELFTRAFKNHLGLDADGALEVGEALARSPYLTKNPKLAKIMLKTFAPLAATAENDGGDGKSKKNTTEKAKAIKGSPSYVALFGASPEDVQAYKDSQKAIKAPA